MNRPPHVTEMRGLARIGAMLRRCKLRNARARGRTLKSSILLVALTAAAALAAAGASMLSGAPQLALIRYPHVSGPHTGSQHSSDLGAFSGIFTDANGSPQPQPQLPSPHSSPWT